MHLVDDVLSFALGHQLNVKYPTVDGIFMSNRANPEQPEFDPGDSDDEDDCLCTVFTKVDEIRSQGLKVANKSVVTRAGRGTGIGGEKQRNEPKRQ